MFERLHSAGQSDRQTILAVLCLVVDNHAKVSCHSNHTVNHIDYKTGIFPFKNKTVLRGNKT